MRAAVLHSLGQAPRFADYPDPKPAGGESIVRITAAPVVPLDLLCASGTSYFGAPAVPYVPGVQGVGVVQQSESVEPGTRIWFSTNAGMTPVDGGLAELVAVPDESLVVITEPVDDHVLAALGLSAVAAWMSLTWKARLRPGEGVLVLGGGGAVGQAAIGAARVLGADRVVAGCRSDEAAGRAQAAGADRVVLTGGDHEGLVERLRDGCGGTVDVVIDPVFGPTATAAALVLAEGGRLVNLGSPGGDHATFSSAVLRSRSIEILGYTNNSLTPDQRRGAITDIGRHAVNGDLAVAHTVHPLSDIEDVWTRQATGDSAGRFVLTCG